MQVEQEKEFYRKGKSPVRRIRETLKDQETEDELRATLRGVDLSGYDREPDPRSLGGHEEARSSPEL